MSKIKQFFSWLLRGLRETAANAPKYDWQRMAKQDKSKYAPDLIPASHIMEVVKFSRETGEYVGMRLMSHGDFKIMVRQSGFRYQEYQKGVSQYHLKDKL